MSDGSSKRKQPDTEMGGQLYRIVPAVYRNRDNADAAERGDLGKYLDAFGALLDQVKATLDQRLADSFPDNPRDGLACQPWLIPYFAQLLDVRLVSPETSGRRAEVARAVSWRQRKGTLRCVEEIAQEVGQTEVEVQEGWKRVAVTPRVGMPLLPERAYGMEESLDADFPSIAARHPGLPAATVDFRFPSRAVRTDAANPAARTSNFGDAQGVIWRQDSLHGAPCFPGSFQDVSARTVDLRSATWKQGHHHPRRLLLFVPPPQGFFTPGWDQQETGFTHDVALTGEEGDTLEGWIVDGTVTVDQTPIRLKDCAIKHLVVNAPVDGDEVIINAEGCLFATVMVTGGWARFEYCTVLEQASFDRLNASDCIFAAGLALNGEVEDRKNCIRYSRIPDGLAQQKLYSFGERTQTNTTAQPVFFPFEHCIEVEQDGIHKKNKQRRQAGFGEPGCGVLHPATPRAIIAGAEDGSEMGAYHKQHYALRSEAVLDKLKHFLPVGMEAAMIPDPRLYTAPPETAQD